MIKSTLLLVIFAAISITSFTQTSKEWNNFKNESISINYPGDWTLTENVQNTIFVIKSTKDSEGDIFAENINLLEQDLTGYDINLDGYIEISLNQVENLVVNSSLLENVRLKKDGQEFHKLVYSGVYGVFELIIFQHLFVKNNKAYVLTMTIEKEKYDEFKGIANQALNSFHFIK